MNRRHMPGDQHGRVAGRAALLVRAVDEILGTHRSGAGGAGCLLARQPTRVRLGRRDFTRYDSAGALDQPFW